MICFPNKFIYLFPPRRAEGHPSVWLYFSCTLLLSWVFPICEESYSVQYTACPNTTARHSDKSQHRETEVYLHSASIHFWSHGYGIEFFPLPALSFLLVRGYDLRALSYLPCFFRGNPIQLESVKAQQTFAYPYKCHLQFPYSRLNGRKWRRKKKFNAVVFQSSKNIIKCMVTMVIYVTISYGDYGERRRVAGAGPEDVSRHQILEDKQWGMWQDVDWLPPSFTGCKGNLSRQRGHSLQHTPDCSLCIHTHTHIHSHTSVPAQGLAPSTWPLSVAERVYTPCDSGTLLSSWRWSSAPPTCVTAESWPTPSLVCCDLHVLQAEVKSWAILERYLPSSLMPDDVFSIWLF